MAYDFSSRLDYVGERMKSLHVNNLKYIRGDTELTIVNFTPERIDVTALAAYGITLVTDKHQDFVFDTAELANLDPSLPLIHDSLVWKGKVYRTVRLGGDTDGEIFRFITSTKKRIRVHAVEWEEEVES